MFLVGRALKAATMRAVGRQGWRLTCQGSMPNSCLKAS